LNNPFAFVEKAKLKFGYTDYAHTEFDGNIAGTTFLNQTYESRFELEHTPLIQNNKGILGFQSSNGEFVGLGEEGKIVPKSNIDTYGLFNVESLKAGAMTYEMGGRIESTQITPDGRADGHERRDRRSGLPLGRPGGLRGNHGDGPRADVRHARASLARGV
jgi:iron complex outermembrane receptor protein